MTAPCRCGLFAPHTHADPVLAQRTYTDGYRTGHHDATNILSAVFELMQAAGHTYDHQATFADQVQACRKLITDERRRTDNLDRLLQERDLREEQATAELQRKDDLITELRKQVEGRDRTIDNLRAELANIAGQP